MVSDKQENAPEEPTPPEMSQQDNGNPGLPRSFYRMLLNIPLCRVTGECDGCGRCER